MTVKDEVFKLACLMEDKTTSEDDRRLYYKSMLDVIRKDREGKKPKRIVPNDFNIFWTAYPLKVAREPAERAYSKAIKETTHDVIMKGLRHYKFTKPDETAFAHAASWLNAKRWQDGQMEDRTAPTIETNYWPEWKKKIAEVLGVVVVNTWFKDAEFKIIPMDYDGIWSDWNYIYVPKTAYQWIKDRYIIELNKIFGNLELRVK